jgi:hypothetical protein
MAQYRSCDHPNRHSSFSQHLSQAGEPWRQTNVYHRRSPAEETTIVNTPLCLITLPRTSKSHEIFQLTSLCHIPIRIEGHKTQTGLKQSYNCQQSDHVWANCKRPSRCMWCGGGHLHKECPERGNTTSIPTCCNCKLVDGENLIPPPTETAGTPSKI